MLTFYRYDRRLPALYASSLSLYTARTLFVYREGEVATVLSAGGSHFGSGGYTVSRPKLVGGEMPTRSPESDSSQSDTFITNHYHGYRGKAGAILRAHSEDCIGEGRDWRELHMWVDPEEYARLEEPFVSETLAKAEAEEAKKAFAAARAWRLRDLQDDLSAAKLLQSGKTGGRARRRVARAARALALFLPPGAR